MSPSVSVISPQLILGQVPTEAVEDAVDGGGGEIAFEIRRCPLAGYFSNFDPLQQY